MNRIKRLSYEVLEKHRSKFGENFADNKKLLEDLTIIRSKGLKNQIAGYITKFIKSEIYDQELNKAKAEAYDEEQSAVEEVVVDPEAPIEEETVIEVGVETPETTEPVETAEEKTD